MLRRVAVTGASGRIGRGIIERLKTRVPCQILGIDAQAAAENCDFDSFLQLNLARAVSTKISPGVGQNGRIRQVETACAGAWIRRGEAAERSAAGSGLCDSLCGVARPFCYGAVRRSVSRGHKSPPSYSPPDGQVT
eukprot:scaffold436_cov267-Pinguiococcus_pyrenoidosus.AAC.12